MYSYGPSHMVEQKQDYQLEHTYSSYVRIRDVVLKTCRSRWTIGRSGERESGISVLSARHDDDDDDDDDDLVDNTLVCMILKNIFSLGFILKMSQRFLIISGNVGRVLLNMLIKGKRFIISFGLSFNMSCPEVEIALVFWRIGLSPFLKLLFKSIALFT